MTSSRSLDPTDRMATGMLTWTREGDAYLLTSADAAALALLGGQSADIVGQRLSDVAPSLAPAFSEALKSGVPQTVEFAHRLAKTGDARTFVLTIAGDGNRVRVYVSDHTDAATIRQTLEETESRYRALFEQLPAGVMVYDQNLVVTDCNLRFAEILSIPRESLLGFDLNGTSDQAPLAIVKAALGGASLSQITPYRTHFARHDLIVKLTVSPLRGSTGEIIGGMVRMEDVTDQRRLDARLRAQFDAIPVPTFAWQLRDRDGAKDFVLVDFNAAADRMSNGKLHTLMGKWMSDEITTAPTALGDMHDCLREDRLIHRQIVHTMNTTGERKVVSVTYSPVPPDMVLTHGEDVTVRVRLEEQLRHAQKMEAVGQLAGGIAHDFNNLLTVIDSYCSLLRDSMEPASPLRSDVMEIRDASERAAGLTRQLLAFSRKQVLRPQSLNLNDVVSRIEPMLRRLIGEDIRTVLDLDPALGIVFADPGQIEQVVMNLAVNARDAMEGGGVLTISTFNRRAPAAASDAPIHVVFSVADTGVGMDIATRERVFEPFFTTKEPGKGTGLGLSTVYGIMEQSGGSVSVQSEPGTGARFELLFPCHVGVAPEAQRRSHPAALVGNGRVILVAEDQDSVRSVVCRILEKRGFRVLGACDGRHAIEVAERFGRPIDLLVTDLVMPEMNGRALSAELTRRDPRIRVLYISGFTDDASVRRGQLPDGAAFLQKPFGETELLASVSALVRE